MWHTYVSGTYLSTFIRQNFYFCILQIRKQRLKYLNSLPKMSQENWCLELELRPCFGVGMNSKVCSQFCPMMCPDGISEIIHKDNNQNHLVKARCNELKYMTYDKCFFNIYLSIFFSIILTRLAIVIVREQTSKNLKTL